MKHILAYEGEVYFYEPKQASTLEESDDPKNRFVEDLLNCLEGSKQN